MSQSVRSVERALDILLCFTLEKPTRSLTQIANTTHVPKATVHRLLAALEKKRFVTKDKVRGRYCLDTRFIEISAGPGEMGGGQALYRIVWGPPASGQFSSTAVRPASDNFAGKASATG